MTFDGRSGDSASGTLNNILKQSGLKEYGVNLVRYAVVIEAAGNNYSAYVPDLPGCVAAGMTREETERLIQEAIEFHVEGLLLDGTPLPEPQFHSDGSQIAVAVAA